VRQTATQTDTDDEAKKMIDNITFDEVFDDDRPQMNAGPHPCAMKDITNTADMDIARVVSASGDGSADLPASLAAPVSPISPCTTSTDECSQQHHQPAHDDSVTGRYSDIERQYHIDARVLGSGHHGSVRKCQDRRTGKRYAVKSIQKSQHSVKPAGLRREISLLTEMRHDGIIGLRDVFEDAEYVHIVTELCEGGELFDQIVERAGDERGPGCFDEVSAARILSQILNAVQYLHDRNIVHRDLKPENILFDSKDGASIKLIDFGLARRHDGRREGPMRTVVGTPYYIAPDVLRKKYDRSCDLWSVGVIAFILLAGYPPFNGKDNAETHRAVSRGRYRFAAEDWKHTTSESRDFVRRLLQTDPARRMTVEEALAHPWIIRHSRGPMVFDDSREGEMDNVEVVLDQSYEIMNRWTA